MSMSMSMNVDLQMLLQRPIVECCASISAYLKTVREREILHLCIGMFSDFPFSLSLFFFSSLLFRMSHSGSWRIAPEVQSPFSFFIFF